MHKEEGTVKKYTLRKALRSPVSVPIDGALYCHAKETLTSFLLLRAFYF
jgi:hypothetical protein